MTEYQKLESPEALEQAFEQSDDETVVVFKHSLTCPVSTRALDEYHSYLHGSGDAARHYLIEVQRQRELSRAVARRTGVKHESPQALVVRGGDVVWHASHWNITKDSLAEALEA